MSNFDLPLILEPSALLKIQPSDELLIISVCQEPAFGMQHIPGAVLIEPRELVGGVKPATGKLPTLEQLNSVFSRVGLRKDKHVIAYDDEGGGWAGRLIWTLDVLRHKNYSYLNGGIISWMKAGYSLESGNNNVNVPRHPETPYLGTIDRSVIADLNEVREQIKNPDSIVWDARAKEEYLGIKQTALRNGHIPGAVNLDWLDLMDPKNDLRLLPLSELSKKVTALGITPDKRVITHCLSHHRSGLSYLVGKALDLSIRAYDGSWSEWGNHADTPIEC
jgi:thiosulfate/3-mercaptopyruvate sulfurtransferase